MDYYMKYLLIQFDNYLDIYIRSEIRNINNGENIIYRIKNSNGEYLNNSDYEILYNDVYYNLDKL